MCLTPLPLQIAGGIWADKVGGKTVLGFGVIWWSVATALTPVAAKLGLPFLLVVRAFMGIGEVSLDNHPYSTKPRHCSTVTLLHGVIEFSSKFHGEVEHLVHSVSSSLPLVICTA